MKVIRWTSFVYTLQTRYKLWTVLNRRRQSTYNLISKPFRSTVVSVEKRYVKYMVIQYDCRGFNNFSYKNTWDGSICIFFYLIEQCSKCLLHILQVLYVCTLCDSTNINTIIEIFPPVSGDGFNGGSDSYLQFRDKHASCLLKLCIPPLNGIVR